MRKITIVSSTPKKFKISSATIRAVEYGLPYFFLKSKPTHVAVIMNPSLNSPLPFKKVFQAAYGDVHTLKYDTFCQDNIIFDEFDFWVEDEVYYQAAEWLWTMLQRPYAFYQLVYIALNLKSHGNPDQFICTELVARLLQEKLGYDLDVNLDMIGIEDILMILRRIALEQEPSHGVS